MCSLKQLVELISSDYNNSMNSKKRNPSVAVAE